MGDASAPNPLTAPYPGPPAFYRHFTKENLERLRALERTKSGAGNLINADLSGDLQFLRPPTPPSDGIYHSFGEKRSLYFPLSVLPSETSLPAPPDFGSTDVPALLAPKPSSLLTLSRSLLLSYLELLQILQANPDATEYGPKWEFMRYLFQKAHATVNAYRGWQGREALIKLMESQVQRGKESVQEWNSMEKRVNDVLWNIAHTDIGKDENRANGSAEVRTIVETGQDRILGENKQIWELLEEESEKH